MSSKILSLVAPVLACMLLTACGPREAGVTETDHGAIFYWEITAAEAAYGDECTDDEEFREGSAPQFEENSFIIYRVSDDGQTATSQDCSTTDAASCTEDVDAQVYAIDGTELLYDPGPEVEDIEGSDCDLQNDQRWLLTDSGETMTAEIELLFNHVGDVNLCAAIEEQLESESGNGQGLDGCTITLNVDAEFHSAQTP